MRKNSIKNTRINGEVQRELSQLISREIKDPRINPMTSVVAVEVAPDLKHAKVYISVLGDEESQKNTLAGLRSAAPYMRGQLARSINLRNTPELTFILDQSIEYGVNMSRLIHEVNKDLENEQTEDSSLEEEDDGYDSEDNSEDDVEDDMKVINETKLDQE
ncbi:30S ribosome-binding factor RbfA [Anaerocolumna sedimenticola]|uniref:Ribosome-binding factor A n=1 Tax=Anaerocolumna sedimenticola TaxID=2696063 RepID=A0A6P1TUX4_9FIRM|nr:30S ribosome-binding factor RbfA [Anaerocolumna sedimenticola]